MRTLKEQIESKCIHFNGLGQDRCRKGVSYDELDKDNRIMCRATLPCMKPDKYLPEGVQQFHCPHVEFPSEEDVQAEIKEHEECMKKMDAALKVVQPIRVRENGKNWRGVLECPICKGKLHVSHAACNGHVHAQCETKDCVAWME